MAELLIRVVDKVNSDPELNVQCLKRGDVVAVVTDGWRWGIEEIANPDWRILLVPGIEPDAFEGLLEPQYTEGDPDARVFLRKRASRLDLSSSLVDKTDGLRAFIEDGTTAPTEAKAGATLQDIAVVDIIPSVVETITPVKDANGTVIDVAVTKDTVERTVTTYPVSELADATRDPLALLTGVEHVGATVRANAAMVVEASLIETLATLYPSAEAADTIGLSARVIG